MKYDDAQEEKWVGYLTGDLPDEEMVRVEQEFIENDATYDHLLALEDDLTYDFFQGKLPAPLSEKWKRRMLNAPPQLKAQMEFASMLKTALEIHPSRSTYSLQPTIWRIAAVLLLAISGWLAFRLIQTQSLYEELQVRYTDQQRILERERQQHSIPKISEPTIAFMISPGAQRSGSVSKKLLVPKDTQSVRLQLEIKNDSTYDVYRAAIRTPEGDEVFSSQVSIDGTKSAKIAILDLPVGTLPANDYQVILSAKKSGLDYEEIAYYVLPRKSVV